jgi:hypothetical protein
MGMKRELNSEIRSGTPMIGLEPSCTAVFRDELIGLLPENEDAQRLSCQTFTLAEFLDQKAPNYKLPPLHRSALVHGHCDDKAILNFDCEKELPKRWEFNCTVPTAVAVRLGVSVPLKKLSCLVPGCWCWPGPGD